MDRTPRELFEQPALQIPLAPPDWEPTVTPAPQPEPRGIWEINLTEDE